ncbi:MAG TPA: 2,3-bisphosphoglycerate-independent phosphoglycerate mutase [Nitrospirae bacterium]|nr:2,3-bisphosphoglycerate-independent phosphoglycerate mutase [Nitrospirota bacterium]
MQGLIEKLIQRNNTKIFMFVLDGVGGLPVKGKTELEAAHTPNLDELARRSATGLHIPVEYGITPGSGPGHLGIFGYNPQDWEIGRGVLEALGLGIELTDRDVAIRCNYATIQEGLVKDRRAGRIPTEKNRALTARLQEEIRQIDEAEIIFSPGMEHRFAVVLRFPEPLEPDSDMVNDTDPQKVGKPPLKPEPANHQSERVARIAEKLIKKAAEILRDEEPANYILLRGISQVPRIPTIEQRFGLRALAIAVYPMYRGLARLIGMDTPPVNGDIKEEVAFLRENLQEYDFFFVHIKKVDSYGEDGNFEAKSRKIEEFDAVLPEILSLKPDVLIVTGDHSTPALMKEHSWHPVPVLIHAPYVLGGLSNGFSERECLKGELGIFHAYHILPIALANTGRLKKFGA